MTPAADEPALRAAVAAAPDDDLPRLVYADWLDEAGQADRADFVRAQVRLAATDPWEPFAVLCRHRRPDWLRGDRWWGTLPPVDGHALEWHPDRAFRRGFGYALLVRDVRWLLAEAPRLFAEAPIGELHLPTATLDEWRVFARADWLPRAKSVHFYSTTTPIEPVRELRRSPLSTGIEEMVFEKSSGPGMPVLLEELFQTPLGRQLRRLELRVGPDVPDSLVRVLCDADPGPRLDRLKLITLPMSADEADDLYRSPLTGGLTGLELRDVPGALPPSFWGQLPELSEFGLVRCNGNWPRMTPDAYPALRAVDLSDNALSGWQEVRTDPGAYFGELSGLRSLRLRRTQLEADTLGCWLTRTAFWPNLVELDLRDNRITDAGARHLLAAPVPADLTALLLAGNPITDGMWTRLRDRFGDSLIP